MARCHCGWIRSGSCITCGWVELPPEEICAVENCSNPAVEQTKYCSTCKSFIDSNQRKQKKLVCIVKECSNPRIKNTRFCSTNCYQTHNRSSTKVVQSNKENDSPSNFNEEFVKCNVAKCRNEVKGTANGGYCESHKWRINRMVCIESGCSLLTKGDELFCFTHKPVNRSTKTTKSDNSSTSNSKPSVKTSQENQDSVSHPCSICGKENTAGRIAKGVGKTVGNTTMGVFGTLTFLTGGLTAPLMLGAGMIGARISGSAEQYDICAECRAS